jgi:UDP-glucose 6-dehydrogenase
MIPFRVDETPISPEVVLDKNRSRFEFYGKCFPEDANEFFSPIIDWFREYVIAPNRETNVIFKLDYFNTSSSKKFIDILNILKEIHKQKKVIVIHWYYRTGDDDMFETGETFSEIVSLPFKFTPY